ALLINDNLSSLVNNSSISISSVYNVVIKHAKDFINLILEPLDSSVQCHASTGAICRIRASVFGM
ncbi:MAG: hypothetical protein II222_04435, partial [Paraprevotella sp.]|nr:hypothetical protein [Paraprevotella sp.]